MKNILFWIKKILTVSLSALVLALAVGCDTSFLSNLFEKAEKPETQGEVLVDFKQSGYEQWLKTEDGTTPDGVEKCSFEATDEGVAFNCTRAWQSRLIYTLPQPIVEKQTASAKGKEEVIYSLTVRYKVEPAGNNFTVEFYDVNGNHAYVNFTSQSEKTTDGVFAEGTWTEGTIYWNELRKRVNGVNTDERLTSLAAMHVRLNTVGSVVIDSVTYTRNEMNFGKEKAGTGEIVLADFGVLQYGRFLSRVDKNLSASAYSLVDGGLEITLRENAQSVWDAAIEYALPSAVAVSEMKTLKFKADSSFLAYVELVGKNGESMPILPTDGDVTVTQTADGLFEYSVNVETRLGNGTFNTESVLTAIRLTSASANSTVFFDEISYVKK